MTTGPVQIIYLNGPSSSGKTTLAKALQHALAEPFLHVGIDKIIGWMPEKINDWTGGDAPLGFSWKKSKDELGNPLQELQMGPYAQKIGETFREVVLALAKMGHRIIIDDVSFGKGQIDEWKETLQNFRVLWVGVNAPLSVLEEREKERGNRIVGSARGQFHKVHVGVVYDLEIDTHKSNFSENVAKIQALMGVHCQDTLLHRNISRVGVYGVARDGHNILVVVQPRGPYVNRFDLPGGGIEFGETIEQTLHREFLEEVGLDFDSMELMTNLTAQVDMPSIERLPSYTFHQIGLIYAVTGLRGRKSEAVGLEHSWVDIRTLRVDAVSPFLWAIIQAR
jgi:chloramphenicol 3-O phosphotransferase